MSEKVNLTKKVVIKDNFNNVVETNFTTFTNEYNGLAPEPLDDSAIELFFAEYEKLFYQIPIYGDLNSHEFLVKRSSELLGSEVETEEISKLLEEIELLRTQLIQAYSN